MWFGRQSNLILEQLVNVYNVITINFLWGGNPTLEWNVMDVKGQDGLRQLASNEHAEKSMTQTNPLIRNNNSRSF